MIRIEILIQTDIDASTSLRAMGQGRGSGEDEQLSLNTRGNNNAFRWAERAKTLLFVPAGTAQRGPQRESDLPKTRGGLGLDACEDRGIRGLAT
jgi:hypothetical protein